MKKILFLKFVKKALLLRDCSSIGVVSFRSPIDSDYAPHLDACLDAAIRRNVQDLKLQLYSLMEPSPLPSSLFRCEMLTELQLCFLDPLRVPSSFCFPSLKVLTLESVKFVDDVSTKKMFSGAALERLSLYECKWADLGVLDIYFYCSSGPLYDYTISGSSALVEATVRERSLPYGSEKRSDPVDHWHRPLKGLLSVKFLTLKGLGLQLHDALPVFRNLISLKLSFKVLCLSSPTLAAILRRCPRLENLEFTEKLHVDHRLVDGILDPPPPCFSSSLKRITVGTFFGIEEEKSASRILLRAAITLEEIVLCCLGDHSEHFYESLLEDLAKLERPGHCRLRLARRVPTQRQVSEGFFCYLSPSAV
ncbi:hypothetical protein ACJRO7_021892 [Eucalyptus globulus]|uniref:F-box/LRR-repeat protein 15/At3g58940/PEG3-like LRR domain-containing protein n=1 Tax=Eucalyptus globulus TaxID=34317 RepID=A0ABD3KSZ6_EUCGL